MTFFGPWLSISYILKTWYSTNDETSDFLSLNYVKQSNDENWNCYWTKDISWNLNAKLPIYFFRFKFFSVVWRVWKHELHETFVDNDLKNGWLLNFEGQNIDDSGRSLSDIAKPKEKTYIGRECTLVTQKNCCSVSVTVNNNLMTKGNWCFPEKKLSP